MNVIEGNIVDIHSKRKYYGRVEVNGNRIEDIVEIDSEVRAGEKYIAPGLVDSHVHIESSMLTPQRFGEMAIRYGNVASVCDPHEIANVLGKKGVQYMMDDAEKSRYKFFFTLPSCVPATPFETNGSDFGAKDMEGLVDNAVALAEMMNYPGVLFGDKNVMAEIELFKKAGKPIDGHVPGLSGDQLKSYVGAGISTDHECSNINEALEKIDLGMKIQIREGSSARNFDALKGLFSVDRGKNVDKLMVCTDDAHPDDIRERGYISRFLRLVKSNDISIFDMYRAALLTPIKHYNLNVGTLKKGDIADFVVFENLDSFEVSQTYIDGVCVFDKSESDDEAMDEVNVVNNFINRLITQEEFSVKARTKKARVIGVTDGELLSDSIIWEHGKGIGEEVEVSLEEDILKIAVINRYKQAPISVGFIKGTGLKRGAMASSIAHDSHNVVVVGADDRSMLEVANRVFSTKGGIAITDRLSVKNIGLPIAGLMTDKNYNEVANEYQSLIEFAKENCGVELKSPFMTMAFMSLLVIPRLKLGDKGLFDVDKFEFVDLFVD